jgi:hypothetical protein
MASCLMPRSAFAEGNGEWSLTPASAEGATGSRTFFDHTVEPGHAVKDLARLANLTDHPLTFNLYAADAYTTPDGGFALRLEADPHDGVGSWVSLPKSTITVPARKAVTFPIQIGVPADAAPGDRAGGIVASIAAPADQAEGPPGLVLEHGVASRIYVRVSGPRHPSLAIEGLDLDVERVSWTPVREPSGARVTYDVANTGNTRLSGEAHLEIADTFGRTVHAFPDRAFKDLLPAERMTFAETWAGVPATDVRFRARVVLDAGDLSTESWSSGAWHIPVVVVVGSVMSVLLLVLGVHRVRISRQGRLRRKHAAAVQA